MAILRINIVTNAAGARRDMNSVGNSAGQLGGGLKKLGAAVAGAFAVGAIVSFGKEVYGAASAVQQSFGALDSVFGKNSAQVKKWAKGAATDVGLAKSEYATLATLIGAQLTNMGRSTKQAANETDGLITLGADLAATYGGSVADAVSAVSSVLKGETDPIERYGISIKQADISARLLAKGQDGLTGTAKKQATATAALALVTGQATAAQGAFGREANTAAGQQERARAQLENLKATIGAGLLPIMTTTFGFINTNVFPAVSRLGTSLKRDLGPPIKSVSAFIGEKLIPAARGLYDWFVVKIAPQVQKFLSPIIAAVGRHFRHLGDTFEGNSGNLAKLGRFLKATAEVLAKLLPVIGKVIGTGINVLSFAIGTVVTVLAKMIGLIDSAVKKLKALGDAIKNNPISKGIGKVGGFVGGLFTSAPLAGRASRLVGGVGATTGLPALATASAGAGSFLGAGTTSRVPLLGAVDNRTFIDLTVTGAVDPTSTARQIVELLRRYDVTVGRAPTFAPATGWAG